MMPDNLRIIYYDNGKVSELYEYEYEDNSSLRKLTGLYVSWYNTGQPRTLTNYANGVMHGWYMSYHANGQLVEKSYYVFGLLQGSRIMWYPNGHKSFEGSFINNKRNGIHATWNPDGTLETIVYCHNGLDITSTIRTMVTDITDITDKERVLVALQLGVTI